jgi:hypothetical protein
MQWLARAAPTGPEGSIGFGAAGRGRVLGPPASALAFGVPVVPNARRLAHALDESLQTMCTAIGRNRPLG